MINQYEWLKLHPEVRNRIAIRLQIPRSEPVHIHGDRVVSDGHNSQDLASVTLEALQAVSKSKLANFDRVFDILVKQVEEELEKEKPKPSKPEERDDVEINRDEEGNLTIKLPRGKK